MPTNAKRCKLICINKKLNKIKEHDDLFQLRVSYEFIVNLVCVTQMTFMKTFSHLMAQEMSVDQEIGMIK